MSTSAEYIPGVAELGRKNQAGGYVGINGSGVVLGTFAQRRDTAANIAGIVLANGELAYTTDTQEIFIGDGSTAGGIFLKQKLQVKQLTYASASLVAAPVNLTTTPTSESISIVLPKSAGVIGPHYRMKIYALFSGGAEALSNFAVEVNTLMDYGAGSQLGYVVPYRRESWFDSSLAMVEDRLVLQDAGGYFLFKPLTELTKVQLSAIIELECYVPTADFVTGSPGPFTVTLCRRISGTASDAYAQLEVRYERLA